MKTFLQNTYEINQCMRNCFFRFDNFVISAFFLFNSSLKQWSSLLITSFVRLLIQLLKMLALRYHYKNFFNTIFASSYSSKYAHLELCLLNKPTNAECVDTTTSSLQYQGGKIAKTNKRRQLLDRHCHLSCSKCL